MNEQMQALCFMAGANSIFYGDKLLTTENPEEDTDRQLMQKLDLLPMQSEQDGEQPGEQQQDVGNHSHDEARPA